MIIYYFCSKFRQNSQFLENFTNDFNGFSIYESIIKLMTFQNDKISNFSISIISKISSIKNEIMQVF